MASETNSSSSSIVEGWLRSVDMVHFTQAFLDNGYDDLEVCKQIGEADLNAIGVPNDHQREKLLEAVRVLREEGGAAVYFTLEDCDNGPTGDRTEVGDASEETPGLAAGSAVAGQCLEAPHPGGSSLCLDMHDLGKQSLVTYPTAQLGYILRDKLVLENIDLSEPPYTTPDLVVCGSSLTALAMRFAEELQTHFMDVLEGLEELWLVARNSDICSDMCRSSSQGAYCGSQSFYYGYPYQYGPQHRLHHPGSPVSQPPPLPACPPPSTISGGYLDRCYSLQSHLDGAHYRPEQMGHQNYMYTDGDSTISSDDKKKSGSVFGRFLRNIGLRKSNRKGSYNKYHGDLSAYEISMSDEDRMALMILVKEGKISTHTALAVVQRFEEGRKAAGKVGPSDSGKENVCDTPSKKGKKKKSIKPLKSQSSASTDDRYRCPQIVSPAECEQICRQRRVHSLGQLDVSHTQPHPDQQYNHQPTRMSLTRALSCSPASTHSPRLTSHMEPPPHPRIYGPSQQQLQQPPPPPSHYHHHHHSLNKVDALRERLTGRPVNTVPKTSSKTSLLSSGSDQSMECGMQTPLRVDPMSRQGVDRAAYNSNSTVSMNSETNSPISGRKKSGIQETMLKSHGSASCSTGDDGISSENDDVEHSSKRSLQTEGGKERITLDLNTPRLSRTKEPGGGKSPLLRQRSAPGSTQLYSGPVLGQAKVILDYVPAPHEKDYLHLKKGDVVSIISMANSGLWLGVTGGKKGKFRFDHVEVIIETERTICDQKCGGQNDGPRTVDDLLQGIGLAHLSHLFLMNGYDDLDIFSELDDRDLDALHVTNLDHRAKILSAARLLVNWPEYKNKTSCPSSLISMDSPSSRAGNSSCDSGCYAGGEAKQTRCRSRGAHSDEKKADNMAGYFPSPNCHFPCNLCGKPKPPRKYSGGFSQFPLGQSMNQSPYSPSHIVHCTRRSPYAAGQFQYPSPQQHYSTYNSGHYGYHYAPGHSHYGQGQSQYTLSVSRTLSELSVNDNHSSPGPIEAFHGRKQGNTTNNSLYAVDKNSSDVAGQPAQSDKVSVGDRVSLTEEDQEIIAITYGTGDARKVTTSVQPYSGRSSQMDMLSSTLTCSACISSTGCAQCDESLLCDSMSCQQCAAYMSCSQCFPYRHYVNTTMRSDSKSSKMSCSSTCTQTTCLSPDHDDSSGGSNLIDYTTTSSQGSYYMVRPNQGKPQQCCYYQQHYPQQPVYSHLLVPAGPPPPAQLPSPASTLAELRSVSPLSLAHAGSKPAPGLTLTLNADAPSNLAPSTLVPPGDWNSHTGDNEAPGMATLYSRARSQTPDKSDKGDGGQMKSPTRSLMPLVSTKLSAEMIDLAQLPYSTAIGHCGIPPLLVQRYSEELRQDVKTMSVVLEQLREKQLRNLGRPCIQNESLSESCKSACDLQISSIHHFLVSIGLPMYQRTLAEGGVSTLEQLLKLKDAEIEQITGADSRHLRRIAHALEWVQLKLAPGQGGRICS